jgi:hypothetical protein
VDVNVGLGLVDINFLFNDGINLGDFTDVPGAAGSPASTS